MTTTSLYYMYMVIEAYHNVCMAVKLCYLNSLTRILIHANGFNEHVFSDKEYGWGYV